MRKRVALFAALLLAGAPTIARAQAAGQAPVACSDSTYLALKRRPVDSLSTREYELFRDRDHACLQQGGAPTSTTAPADATGVESARAEGRTLAEERGTAGWFVGGLGSGLLVGLTGTAIFVILYAASQDD